jgi:hypothetical protein
MCDKQQERNKHAATSSNSATSACDKQQERNKHAAAEQEHLVDLAFSREAHGVDITLISCWKWSGVTYAQAFVHAHLPPTRAPGVSPLGDIALRSPLDARACTENPPKARGL